MSLEELAIHHSTSMISFCISKHAYESKGTKYQIPFEIYCHL